MFQAIVGFHPVTAVHKRELRIIEITVPWIPAYTKSMSWVLLVASVP